MLLVSPSLGGAKTVGFGTGKPTTTVYGTDYADDHAIDPDADDVRHDLHPAWITLTSDEVIFHYPGIIGLRPGPVEVIERLPQYGRRAGRGVAQIAADEHGLGPKFRQGLELALQRRQRHIAGADDMAAAVLLRAAHVQHDGAVVDQTHGVGRRELRAAGADPGLVHDDEDQEHDQRAHRK